MATASAAAPSPRRPNVLFIMGDDHAPYVTGAYGNRLARTPNLDRLAREGLRFERAYANSPVCTPSRQSIITGKLPHSAGVTLLTTPLAEGQLTIAEHLKRFGYRTGAVGKMHFNSESRHGFDYRLDRADHRRYLKENPPRAVPEGLRVKPPWRPFRDPARVWMNAEYLPLGLRDDDSEGTFFARRVVEFLERRSDQPFCLWLSFYEPHSPFDFPVEYAGMYDLKMNLTEQAEKLFARALKLNEQNPKADARVLLRYADYLSKVGKFAESLPVFTKALALNSHSSDALYGRANAHEKLKDFARASADALAAVRESPQRKDAYQLLLRVNRAANNQEKAAEYAAAIEKLAAEENARHALARDLRAALRQAEPLLREGKFAEAKVHYEEIIKLLPTFYEAYFALGICYAQTARLDEAEAAFKKYLSFQPLSADGHASLGLLLLQRKRHQEAKDELERALKLDPSLDEARKGLARVHTLSGEHAAARRELEQVISADPNVEPEVYLMLATAEFNLKDKARARDASERGLKVHSGAATLEDFYAALLVDCGATLECRQKLAEALRRTPNSPAYLKAVARLLLREDPRNSQAEEMLARIVRALPTDAEARYLFAQWAHLNNKFQLSLDESNAALALPGVDDQTRMQIHALTALTEESLNNSERAAEAFQRSLDINRKLPAPSPLAAFRYVEFLVKHNRDAEARALTDEIIKWDVSFAPARLERAKFLAKGGKTAEAIAEGTLALQNSEGHQDQLRAAHAFLAKTYFAAGRMKEAQTHQSWIETHSMPQP